jgi:hypothetical protein
MGTVFKLIEQLFNFHLLKGNQVAECFPDSRKHLIGVDNEHEITLFINFTNINKAVFGPSEGQFLTVRYDVECKLERHTDKKVIHQNFCLLKLKNVESDILLRKIFLDLCLDLVQNLGDEPEMTDINIFMNKVKQLFAQLTLKSDSTELGLWGELFLIANSKDVDYAIKAWHVNKNDRFDFNDSKCKVEVKTTTRSERIHHFSLAQLDRLLINETVICSIMTCRVDIGTSIFDLYQAICKKATQVQMEMFKEKLFQIAGIELAKFNSLFDFQMAIKSTKIYLAKSIPSIDSTCISLGVNNVEFDTNLHNSIEIEENKLKEISILLDLSL